MTLSELAKKKPECPYYVDRHCEWASQRLGRLVATSTVFCNFECAKHGPYQGKEVSEEKQKKFLNIMWQRTSPIGAQQFALKVLRHHYMVPVDIEIPEEYSLIKEKLLFLEKIEGFLGIYLTGSIIIKNSHKPHKDYDIVLRFKDVKSILNANLEFKLPEELNGIKLDYFYYIGENPEVYFACLDVDMKILYTSPWFDLKIGSIPSDIKVVVVPTKFDDVLKSILKPDKT